MAFLVCVLIVGIVIAIGVAVLVLLDCLDD